MSLEAESPQKPSPLERIQKLYPDAVQSADGWLRIGAQEGVFLRVVEDRLELALVHCSRPESGELFGAASPGSPWRSTSLARVADEANLGAFVSRGLRARLQQFVPCQWCGRFVPEECTSGWSPDMDLCQSCFDRINDGAVSDSGTGGSAQ